MRIFRSRWRARFARREGLANDSLRDAIDRAERGLVDADPGGGLIKQRVASRGRGRSGGYRMLVAYKTGDRAIFLFGFAKNDLGNVDDQRLAELRTLGDFRLAAGDKTIDDSLAAVMNHGRWLYCGATSDWCVEALAGTDVPAASFSCHSARRAAIEPPSMIHNSL